jgi:polysaccharide pyruvyl transferase WcaK-like protein
MDDMSQSQLQDKRKRRKISFFGNFGQRNLGNEATLLAILHNLRRYLPDAEMNCICTDPVTTAKTYKIAAVSIHDIFVKPELLQSNPVARLVRKIFIGIPIEFYRWIRAISFLGDTDMVIVPGTQFLSDNLTGPWGWPYMLFKWSVAAKLRRCKLLFVSVGVGPLHHTLSRFFVKFALRLADFRSYRDQCSKEYVGSIGLKRASDRVYPDLAFSLATPAVRRGTGTDAGRPVVAVGVIDFHGQFRPSQLSADDTYGCYVETVSAFVTWLLERSYTVRLVIGDVSYDTQVLADLQKILSNKVINFEKDHLIVQPIGSLDELISQLATSDIIVSPRFHNIVFGLLLNKPVLALSYHEKFAALLESFDLNRFDLPIEDADIDTITERFHELERNCNELKRQIGVNVHRYRVSLDEQYGLIVKFFTV